MSASEPLKRRYIECTYLYVYLLETSISVNVSYAMITKENEFMYMQTMLDRKPLCFAVEKFYRTDRKTVGLFCCYRNRKYY